MSAIHTLSRRRILGILSLSMSVALLLPITQTAKAGERNEGARGIVFTETNAAAGNAIAVFYRESNGMLRPVAMTPTGGLGTGTGLGNQGALVLSENGRWLFAVNAGSSDISVFSVEGDRLRLIGRTPSGGVMPISLTLHENLLYALNAGGVNNITGFVVGHNGRLTMIPGSTQPLSGPSVGPAEVAFNRMGDALVVTEKATSLIDTFMVGSDGRASGPQPQASSGATPFGFNFSRRGTLIVSEASGSVSSYDVEEDGGLRSITASAPTHQPAPCWIAVTPGGHYAYTTNAHGGTISGFQVLRDGKLNLLDASGVTAITGNGSAPLDMVTSGHGRFLHVLLSGYGAIGTFRIAENGRLSPVGMAGGLPGYASGLAAL